MRYRHQRNLQFTNSTYTQDEAPGAVTAGCLDYTIVNVPISIGSEPSAAADVTITTAGTATLGQDYTISPTSFTFSGSTLSGTVDPGFKPVETLYKSFFEKGFEKNS